MKYLVSFILVFSFNCFGSSSGGAFSGITTYSIGMVQIGVTENQSSLEQTDTEVESEATTASESTSVSAISFNLNYEFSMEQQKSYFFKATVPMMTSDGSALFLGGVGFNWYLNKLGSVYKFSLNGNELQFLPKLRYWWGASTGVGYLIYNTISAKKTDIIFDLAVHGGAGYNFSNKWGMKMEAIVGRGTGIATTTMNIRIFAGAVYFL